MKKERKLDRLYTEFERDYSGKSEEEMKKIISNLEKEISGKESALKGLEKGEAQQNLEKSIEQAKKRLENLKGYTKNKTQIEGIRKYRDSLVRKMDEQTAIKDESEKLYKEAVKSYREATKKLADTKYTMTLDGDEYNALLQQQDDAKKEANIQAKRYHNSKNRIVELQSKISKCNLAWKTLFVNKDWDEINKVALSEDKRFTRKVDSSKSTPISTKKQNVAAKTEDEEEKNMKKAIAENVNKFVEEGKQPKTEKKKETKALVEQKEGFFKKIWNKIVRWVKGEEQEKSTSLNNGNKTAKSDSGKEEPQKSETKQERDSFLEGLRQHVDVEYREATKKQKEEAYIETHKVKPNEQSR